MSKKYPTTFLTTDQLNQLTTKRLLAYKKSLYPYLNWMGDYYDCNCNSCIEKRSTNKVFQEQIDLIKFVLKSREHINK